MPPGLIDEIEELSEARNLFNWYDQLRLGKKPVPQGYLNELVNYTISSLSEVSMRKTISDVAGKKFGNFASLVNRLRADSSKITRGDVLRLAHYVHNRLFAEYRNMSRT